MSISLLEQYCLRDIKTALKSPITQEKIDLAYRILDSGEKRGLWTDATLKGYTMTKITCKETAAKAIESAIQALEISKTDLEWDAPDFSIKKEGDYPSFSPSTSRGSMLSISTDSQGLSLTDSPIVFEE